MGERIRRMWRKGGSGRPRRKRKSVARNITSETRLGGGRGRGWQGRRRKESGRRTESKRALGEEENDLRQGQTWSGGGRRARRRRFRERNKERRNLKSSWECRADSKAMRVSRWNNTLLVGNIQVHVSVILASETSACLNIK